MNNQEEMLLTLGDSESQENSGVLEEIEEEHGCFPSEQEIQHEIADLEIDFNDKYWGNVQENMQLPNQVDN